MQKGKQEVTHFVSSVFSPLKTRSGPGSVSWLGLRAGEIHVNHPLLTFSSRPKIFR